MKKAIVLLFIAIFLTGALSISSCIKEKKSLIVYSGKGLKKPVEEIKNMFEHKYNIKVKVVYTGSNICLEAIKETKRGDVFIPGSIDVLKKAGDLVDNHQYVALHVPIIAVYKDNPKRIHSFSDLAKPGIRLAIGDANMCAIGKIADEMIEKSGLKENIAKNIEIRTPTVNELLNLLIKQEIDVAIIWEDMLKWPEAENIKGIKIPSHWDMVREISVAVLTISEDKDMAQLFADFVASKGRAIFRKYGFRER